MDLYVYAEVDENDGDYVGALRPITAAKAEQLLNIVQKMKEHSVVLKDLRWEVGECAGVSPKELYGFFLSNDDIKLVNSILPYHEYGFQSIHCIKIMKHFADIL